MYYEPIVPLSLGSTGSLGVLILGLEAYRSIVYRLLFLTLYCSIFFGLGINFRCRGRADRCNHC